MAGVQRAAGPLRQVQSGERLVSVQRWTLGSPPKPSAAVSVGRGGARERSEEYPSGCSEWSGLCDDEGRVQGGSACWVSRGQSPLGRVQGDNACSGVQRVKPLAQ